MYYAGSGEQWKKIEIASNNDSLTSATIHCNSSGAGNGGIGGGQIPDIPNPDTPSAQKKAQSITANDMTKTYGEKPFSLGVSALGGAALSYTSSNAKVASVASGGTVTVRGCGVAVITIAAAENAGYEAASKTVTLTVRPKKATLVSVKSKKKKTARKRSRGL